MNNFDINILKKNINTLMEKRGTKQKELAKYLEMSQPNVSKALNEDDKKCFTVEQIFRISNYFKVSIDYLVGNRTVFVAETNREIAEMLVKLIETGAVSFSEIEMEERVLPSDNERPYIEECNVPVTYHALYFRNYWMPEGDDIDGSQSLTIQMRGNATNNSPINKFLDALIKLYDMFKRDELPEEAYRAAVQGIFSIVE